MVGVVYYTSVHYYRLRSKGNGLQAGVTSRFPRLHPHTTDISILFSIFLVFLRGAEDCRFSIYSFFGLLARFLAVGG